MKSLYITNKTLGRSVGEKEKWFEVSFGLRQGNEISPLFYLVDGPNNERSGIERDMKQKV